MGRELQVESGEDQIDVICCKVRGKSIASSPRVSRLVAFGLLVLYTEKVSSVVTPLQFRGLWLRPSIGHGLWQRLSSLKIMSESRIARFCIERKPSYDSSLSSKHGFEDLLGI